LAGGGVRCSGLSLDSAQGDRVIVDIIRRMGGQVRSGGANESRAAAGAAGAGEGAIGKPEGEIEALPSATHGTIIDASQCPDLVPVLAVLGALSRGVTRIINAKRLRVKESDRLRAISTELGKLGADVTELEDGLIIEGKETLRGGKVDSWNDHRIAMALAVASIKCTQPVVITGSGAVKKSYPHFWRDFSNLGGKTDPPPQSLF
jgi:3-phosphoshikimate 1-carboxyvinyltransferase